MVLENYSHKKQRLMLECIRGRRKKVKIVNTQGNFKNPEIPITNERSGFTLPFLTNGFFTKLVYRD